MQQKQQQRQKQPTQRQTAQILQIFFISVHILYVITQYKAKILITLPWKDDVNLKSTHDYPSLYAGDS